ncbi:MAG: AAA family ATPase, partial [Isosphaeraceae bacterium]|nr:AAA family ATPase [Isosphaeraceae bacterium]
MGHLKQVHIRRFKRLEDISLCLDGTNVLIGANNAGKSSVLQAIHFAVSVAQTSKLLGGVSWRQDSYELSFNPSQLLYSPVA